MPSKHLDVGCCLMAVENRDERTCQSDVADSRCCWPAVTTTNSPTVSAVYSRDKLVGLHTEIRREKERQGVVISPLARPPPISLLFSPHCWFVAVSSFSDRSPRQSHHDITAVSPLKAFPTRLTSHRFVYTQTRDCTHKKLEREAFFFSGDIC